MIDNKFLRENTIVLCIIGLFLPFYTRIHTNLKFASTRLFSSLRMIKKIAES